ncbi:MAG: asparagine synthase (glutamine-hydrolyzing), partial [Thermodesulfobacteriota bacterium]
MDKNLFGYLTRAMAHRGPDDEGYLFVHTDSEISAVAGGEDTPTAVYNARLPYNPTFSLNQLPGKAYDLALSNRRLAIIDLSPAGHQPMSNEDGTIWIVHNGEVYNFLELRDELKSLGHCFVSNTDTEVILHAYEEWGPDCLNKFNGMWAFCIWDSKNKKLFCARDRFGIKSFYYYLDGNLFAFASEIKPLLMLGISREPNDALVYDFLRWGILDHTDETFFKGIKKLSPSHYLSLDLKGSLKIGRYWDLKVSNEVDSKYDDEKYAEELLELFIDAVRLRLRSDVLIGSCLSGGLDSSSIVCVTNTLMFPNGNSSASDRQKTFSSCFENKRFDEREYIEEVIRKTQAEKNYIFPTPEGFLEELDELLSHQEEPFGGTSVYAQWLVMKKARDKGVIVMLDGQGGDEQLCGYRKFYIFYLLELAKKRKYARLVSEFARFFFSIDVLKTLNLRKGLRYFELGNKVLGVSALLNDDFKKEFAERQSKFGYRGDLGQRIKEDLFQFSLPVLLRYEDKNSMAHSVEARLPFLDYRLVEMIASLPLSMKMKDGWTKYVLRQAMSGILPEKIRQRRSKLGFVTPEDVWFRNTVISRTVSSAFSEPAFIGRYVRAERLIGHFHRYLANWSVDTSEFFFRFFVLELWGRRFILDST